MFEKIKLAITILKGDFNMNAMVDVYVTLIVNHRRNITQVPVQLQDLVLADLNAMGLDGYGNPLPPATPTQG